MNEITCDCGHGINQHHANHWCDSGPSGQWCECRNTPNDVAKKTLSSTIDPDKLAEVLDGCFPGCDGPAAEDFIARYVVSAVDAVLASLPELMGGEQK